MARRREGSGEVATGYLVGYLRGMGQTPHSAPVLTEHRDAWWSTDYLALVAKRLNLSRCMTVADIGCGQGHWGQRLLSALPTTASLTGIDGEATWVDTARRRAVALGTAERCRYEVGKAEALPLPDDAFDLVTCQTLLMHVANVCSVIAEMVRIVRPGGQLLFAEPNNVAQQFSADTVNRALTPAQVGSVMTLFTACSRGRDALGRGDDCVGDRLPALLQGLALVDLEVCQNERACCIVPPYDAADVALLEQTLSYAEMGFWLWDRGDARLLYEAGGGQSECFDKHYAAFSGRTKIFKTQVREQQYACNNGSLHYLVSARRPA
ncbi:MAG: class I SAM-dependent methyltransferase [Deltaproteobacteria bacterium]|nr:class I SAM-dependent methyltransferase [Deltaproteobacteria bacterium]